MTIQTRSRPTRSYARPRRIATVPRLCLLLATATAIVDARADASTAPTPAAESWLEVRINGRDMGTALVLRGTSAALLVNRDDLAMWRLPLPGAHEQRIDGRAYVSLDGIPSLRYRIDEAQQVLLIDVAASSFDTTRISGARHAWATPSASPLGAFLNYDASLSRTEGAASTSAALVELGGFGPSGTLTETQRMGTPVQGGSRNVRLDTTWTADQPAHAASFRLGDAISGASDWGRAIRFGGVQWATDFSTQPGLVTYPLPSFAGTAATPSTVDLYVNQALRLQRDVPAGPFDIRDLPVLTGQGNLQLVVRDLLGQEQVITQPFNTGGGLLASGLRSYSYEVGFERRNYGLESNDYGTPVFVATERRGLSDALTGELHTEARHGQYTLGVSGNWRLDALGIAHVSIAGSGGRAGGGASFGAGFEHAGPAVSYGIRGQWRTSRFLQLGYDSDQPPPKRTETAYFSVGTTRAGSASFNYTREDLPGQPELRLAGVAYNLQLGRDGYFSTSAMTFLRGGSGPVISLTYTHLLGPRDSLSASARSQDGTRGGTLGYRHALPVDSGVGYGVQAGMDAHDPSRADLDVQTDSGTYTVEGARIANQEGWRATARGSVVLLGGRVYASRHLDEGFASVQVPGFANVRIYADNQPVATTDADGYALVPRLRPYQDNPIRIEQADLPLDARIQTLELHAIPARNSAVALRFPAERVRSALLTLMLPGGGYVPAGAEVRIAGRDARFPVGERGEAYLTDLDDTTPLIIQTQGKSCALALTLPATTDPLPHVGPLACTWQESR